MHFEKIFFSDLNEASDVLYSDEQDESMEENVQVSAFGAQEASDEDAFGTSNVPFNFCDPHDIENFQADIIECFVEETPTIATLAKDLALKGFWPLLLRILAVADEMFAKMSSIKLLTSLISNNCITWQPKQMHEFVQYVIQLMLQLVKRGNVVDQDVLSDALKWYYT